MTNKHAYPHDFGMEPNKGLTKREYVATHIAAALIPHMQYNTPEDIAERAARVADAILEELKTL